MGGVSFVIKTESHNRLVGTVVRSSKEPLHRTTINIPYSVYEELRKIAYATGVPMSDQLVNAWKELHAKEEKGSSNTAEQ